MLKAVLVYRTFTVNAARGLLVKHFTDDTLWQVAMARIMMQLFLFIPLNMACSLLHLTAKWQPY
jgi:hypothetical protein